MWPEGRPLPRGKAASVLSPIKGLVSLNLHQVTSCPCRPRRWMPPPRAFRPSTLAHKGSRLYAHDSGAAIGS